MSLSVDYLKAASRLCDACLRKGLRFSYDEYVFTFHIPVRSNDSSCSIPGYVTFGGSNPDPLHHINTLIKAVEGLVSP